jgi:hypothetical protein
MNYQGMDVDAWAQAQTLNPAPSRTAASAAGYYTGYDSLDMHWSALVPELPLEVRYASFVRRLNRVLARNG